jgi:hypothetical protein
VDLLLSFEPDGPNVISPYCDSDWQLLSNTAEERRPFAGPSKSLEKAKISVIHLPNDIRPSKKVYRSGLVRREK